MVLKLSVFSEKFRSEPTKWRWAAGVGEGRVGGGGTARTRVQKWGQYGRECSMEEMRERRGEGRGEQGDERGEQIRKESILSVTEREGYEWVRVKAERHGEKGMNGGEIGEAMTSCVRTPPFFRRADEKKGGA